MAERGSSVTFSVLFLNSSGAAADPTTVTLRLREEIDGTEPSPVWTYKAVPVSGTDYPTGMNPIAKSATGTYSLVWVTRKPERITAVWRGVGVVDYTLTQTEFVRHSLISAIDT